MIEVEGPDGSVVEFPDGTPMEVMQGAMAKRFGSPTKGSTPPAQTDTSLSSALAKGGENVANALGALVSETGKHIGGGKQFPKLMAMVAAKLHNDKYRSGMEDAANPNADLGTRAAGVGRALVEGAPGMALSGLAGLAAGPAGFIGAQAALQTGGAIEGVRQADQVPEDQALGGSQLARVAADSALSTALNSFGAGKALSPMTKGLGMQGVKQALGEVAGAAKAGAIANAGQTIADKVLITGELPSMGELEAAMATGGAAGFGVRAPKAVPEIGESIMLRGFKGQNPEAIKRAAELLNKNTGSYGSIKEGNAEDIRLTAGRASKKDMDFEAKGQGIKGPNLVEDQIDAISRSGSPEVGRAYVEAMSAVDAGEPVRADQIALLRQAIGGNPVADNWLDSLETSSILGQLGNMGSRKGDARMGGLHATSVGQTIDRIAKYFGPVGIAENLLSGALGHASMGGVGLPIGLTAGGLSLGMRGIDALTGYSNPVGRFARRFADEAPAGPQTPPAPLNQPANVSPMQTAMQASVPPMQAQVPPMQAQVPPMQAPAAPVTTPQSLMLQSLGFAPGYNPTPSEMALVGKLLKRAQKQGREVNLGPMPGEDLTADPARQLPPGADASFRAPPPEAEPSAANLAKLDALLARRAKQATQVEPSDAFKQTLAATKAAVAARRAFGDKLAARGKPADAPKAQRAPKVEASVEYAPEAPPQAEQAAPERPMHTVNVFGRDVSIPLDEIRRTPQAWERGVLRDATIRRQPIEAMKGMLPKDLHDDVEGLFTTWLAGGTKMVDAQHAFETLVNDPRVPDELKGQLLDLWASNKYLTDPSHWE